MTEASPAVPEPAVPEPAAAEQGPPEPVVFEGRVGVVHPITTYGTPVLHRRCTPVTAFDDDLVQLVADMFASMAAADGVGLAANQIGVDARVFVVDCPDEDGEETGEHVVGHVVNPVLELPTGRRRKLDLDGEGCLSVPGEYSDLARPDTCRVTGFDVHGEPVSFTGTGLLARCLQHETDHLEGVVYVDRLAAGERAQILAAAGLPVP